MRGLWMSLAIVCSLSTTVLAEPEPVPSLELIERQTSNSTNVSAATWIYEGRNGDRDGDDRGNFTFTITVNPDNDDMWFRMAAPAMYSWIGIGAGTSMGNAKAFFMAWEGSGEDSITLTARSGCDKCEPAYLKGFGVNSRDTSSSSTDPARYGIRDGMYYISGFVANGTRRAGIDPRKKDQPFMWAVGPPGYHPNSNDFDVPLRMHSMHGRFQLDMTKAHGQALPAFATTQNGVTQQGSSSRDSDRSSKGHALLMCVGFVIVLPLGILLLKLTSVKAHMITQGVALLLITIGWVTGFIISGRYQRSMNFNSPHQIIGIVVYLLLLAQFLTGFFHHRVYLKTQQSTWMIKPHKFGLGGVVLALGIVNCAVGFRFANAGYYNIIFVPVVIGMAVLIIVTILLRRVMAKRKAAANPAVFGGPAPPYQAPHRTAVPPAQGYYGAPPPLSSQGSRTVGASWDQRSEVELGKMGPPPSYTTEPQRPREMI